jgi:hypothetical protein
MVTGFFERRALDGLEAVAEALFPQNDYGAPDFKATELVRRTVEYMDVLPRDKRRLLVALFALTELAAPLLVPGFSRFSRLTVQVREEAVRRFRKSRFLPVRLLGDALKATTTLIYMSHPLALSYVGAYSTCARPLDPMMLPFRDGALAVRPHLPVLPPHGLPAAGSGRSSVEDRDLEVP